MNKLKLTNYSAIAFLIIAILLITNSTKVLGQNEITIHNVGHGTLYCEYKNLIIHVDPYSKQANYDNMPKADIILITHGHSDHYDLTALNKIKTDSTMMVCTKAVKDLGTYAGSTIMMQNGDSSVVKNIPIKAVPAYNLTSSFHPKGQGNGYILTLGEKKIYIAGDTEFITEMGNLGQVDVAFLPMNLPYTMTPEMAAEAAKKIKPSILYIYHFGNSDTAKVRTLLKNEKMNIRIGTSVFKESDKKETSSGFIYRKESENKFALYPNPARDVLHLQNDGYVSEYSIANINGKVISRGIFAPNERTTISLNNYNPGVYFLNVSNFNSKFQTKLLKL